MMRFGWDNLFAIGGGMMLWGWLFGILILVLIVFGIIALVRYLQGGNVSNSGPYHVPPSSNSALQILNERYARGEINDAEYAAKKAELRK